VWSYRTTSAPLDKNRGVGGGVCADRTAAEARGQPVVGDLSP